MLLPTNISTSECSIKVFHYKATVLLESIDLWSYICTMQLSGLLQFVFSLTALLGRIKENKLDSLKYLPNMVIMLAYLK